MNKITLYGIPNCDTMKKARKWLAENQVDYDFHDYKKAGIDADLLDRWIADVGWEALLNRRGMMWRKVPPEVKDAIDEDSARRLMLDTPTIIKRPVMTDGARVLDVGFDAARYADRFG